MGVLSTLAGGLAGLFVKKVPPWNRTARRSRGARRENPRKPWRMCRFHVVVWHFILWPVLNYFSRGWFSAHRRWAVERPVESGLDGRHDRKSA